MYTVPKWFSCFDTIAYLLLFLLLFYLLVYLISYCYFIFYTCRVHVRSRRPTKLFFFFFVLVFFGEGSFIPAVTPLGLLCLLLPQPSRPPPFTVAINKSIVAKQERFDRLRYVELKHGRISMLAILGHITAQNFRFPGMLSPSAGLSFADCPNGVAALSKIPIYGLLQIFLFIGFLETRVRVFVFALGVGWRGAFGAGRGKSLFFFWT